VVGEVDPVILRHPVTHEKIRCREDLVPVAGALADGLADDVRDRDARRTADAALWPFSLVGRGATALGMALLFPPAGIVEPTLSPDARALYAEARDAYLAGRFEAARDLFLATALARDGLPPLPATWKACSVYYLALCDEALHRPDEAAEALRRFLTVTATPDEARYLDAERRLAQIAPGALPTCASREPLTLPRGGQP
jgi:hypothetical protein